VKLSKPLTFFAQERVVVDEAWPGDIIGIPNHGVLRVGDTLSESGQVVFTGIPNFAPEILQRVRVKDPLKAKHLKKALEATVSFVGRNINQLSRTFTVEVKLPASTELRPNMTAVIKVVYESHDKTIVIPVNVVQTVNNEKIVYVAEKNGENTVARRKVIQVGGILENRAEVTGGLAVGDQLITTGYQGLNDGELVKI